MPTISNIETSTEDHANPAPTCPVCGGLGFLRQDVPVDDPAFGKLVPCACRLEEMSVKRLHELRKLSNLEGLDRYTFDNFVPEGLNPETQRNLRRAFEMAFEFANQPQGWLVLIGGYGCGKTHLAAAIANERIARHQPALFVNVPDLLDHLRATYKPTSPVTYDERFELVRTAPLLIMDDLGTENTTPWAGEKLYQILNYRYNAQLPTVITTNHRLEELDPRLRSRMNDQTLSRVWIILAPDFRGSGQTFNQSDLNSLEHYRHQTFSNFFHREELSTEEQGNLQRALVHAQAFAEEPQGWLLFTGGHGSGKTHLAAAIANYRVDQGHPALFIVVPDLLDHLRATYSPTSSVSYDQRFAELRTAPLLILDDLGTHSTTDWAREKLYQLFNYRYQTHLPTVITSALDLQELERQDALLFSRLIDPTRCVRFGILAPPYRGVEAKMPSRGRGRR